MMLEEIMPWRVVVVVGEESREAWFELIGDARDPTRVYVERCWRGEGGSSKADMG